MTDWNSVDEVLDYAIAREHDAVTFYTELAATMEKDAMRRALAGFADEERGHAKKLERIRADGVLRSAAGKVRDLKIADYQVDVEPDPGMAYEEVLVVAMKREKAAFRLYSDLADAAGDPAVALLLRELAQEEAKHKLRFEVEYDESVLKEN